MSTGAGAPVYQSTLTQVNGNIIVGTGPDTPTFSTTTGLLQILNGGVGIGKSLWVGTTATVAGTLKVGGTVSNDIVLTSSQIYRSGGSVSIGGGNSSAPNITGTAGFVAGNNSTADIYGGSGAVNLRPNANYQVVVYSNSSTFSTQTGGLQIVNGGVGIGGGMYVGGIITATNVYVNGYAVSTASALTIQGAGVSLGSAGTINFATGTIVTVGSNLANVWLNTATLMQVATQVVQSLSTGTGILGGSYNGSTAQTWSLNTATLMANAVTAINLAGGTAGQLAYQTGAGTTSFAGTATTGNFLQAYYTGAPTWTSTGSMYVYRATQADSASGSAGSVANALTIGTGLSGTSASYNGSAAVTISLNTATLVQTATQVVQSHSTGTGILGSAYNGSTAQTWTLDTSTLMARSVQTVQSLTAGTGLSGTAFNGSTAQTWTLNTATLMQIATQVVQAVTFNNSNTGDASGTTYNGGTARTVSANTLGALSLASGGTISGAVTFSGPVTFSGTATYVSSTQTYYTDNIINLHVPPGGVDAGWTLDDGKDIGLRFHYFNSTDTNAALVLANDSKFLEWYAAGAEGTSTFVGSYYGNFKTGNIVAGRGLRVGSLASSTATVVGEKLYVSGGIYATDYITATTFVGAMSQSITAGTGLTGTAYNGGTAQTWSLNTATLMQVATQVVQSHSTGTGILGSAYNGSTAQTWSLDTSTLMNKVVNLASGAAGSLPYQSGANATTYLGIGTSGYILTSNGSAPTWTAANGLSAGSATTATSAGTAYATIGTLTAGTGLSGTAFNGSANQTWTLNTATLVQTATQVVQSISAGTGLTGTAYNGSTAQTWSLNTATLMANAVTAINLSAGSAMAVPYQSASGTTAYLAAGTSGYVLQTNGTGSAPSWVAASTLAAGSAPLTNTYVGYGSASNLLTGSSNVTWDGSKFYVNGILDITGNSSPTGTGLTLGYSSTGGYKWIQSFNSQPLYINPLGNNVIFNRDGGSVGIGTTSPSGKLHVYTGSASGAIAYFEGDSGRYLYTGVDSGHYIEQVGTSSGNRNLRIQSSNGAGTYTVLYVDGANQRIYTSSNASVGIGTSSPVATLDVRGGLAVSGWSNNNGGSSGGLEIGWDSTQGLIQSYNRTGSAYTAITLNGSINKFLTGGTEWRNGVWWFYKLWFKWSDFTE
jgi:hypothetical protein